MVEFACPKCKEPLIVLEVNSKHFKFKVLCFSCSFYNWVDDLKEIQ